MSSKDDGQTMFVLSYKTAFFFLVFVRTLASVMLPIADCDESFNYWEPLHMILYGSGQQTWEYSPEYGLRSYFYIWLHAVPAWVILAISKTFSKMELFMTIRFLLGAFSAYCDANLYETIKYKYSTGHVALYALAFLGCSAGMFSASVAFLPSSFSMCVVSLSLTKALNKQTFQSIFWMGLGIFVGWPFCVLLALPVALALLLNRVAIVRMITYAIAVFCILTPFMLIVDQHYYGKAHLPWLNIVMYNVFNQGGGSSELYGVEPWYYYILNGLLNFNIVFLLAFLTPIFLVLQGANVMGPTVHYFATFFIWFAFMSVIPHKEERFLFVVYPMLCVSAAASLNAMRVTIQQQTRKLKHFFRIHPILDVVVNRSLLTVVLVAVLLSLFRIAALVQGYGAPFQVYRSLVQHVSNIDHPANITVCVGKEWYRFPSAFFLPNNAQLAYIKSDFTGQLPKPFVTTQAATTGFSHLNTEDMTRYVSAETSCHYLVDLDAPWQNEPHYYNSPEWTTITAEPFLDTRRSRFPWRSIFVPFVSEKFNVYSDYVLLQNKALFAEKKKKSTKKK